MVGVREAEQLAHHMESYLRILREEPVRLSQEGIDCLIASTKMLEQVISAKREQHMAPDITAAIVRLGSDVSDGTHLQACGLQ